MTPVLFVHRKNKLSSYILDAIGDEKDGILVLDVYRKLVDSTVKGYMDRYKITMVPTLILDDGSRLEGKQILDQTVDEDPPIDQRVIPESTYGGDQSLDDKLKALEASRDALTASLPLSSRHRITDS